MVNYIGLDFETYSNVDLKKHGLARYIAGADFTVLCASLAGDLNGSAVDESREYDFITADEPERAKADFLSYLKTLLGNVGNRVYAQNVGFERAVLAHMGLSSMYYMRIRDSAVIARCEGASSSLEQSLKQLTGLAKIEQGAGLIQKFSVPNDWNDHKPPTAELILGDADSFKKWVDFKVYCTADAQGSQRLGWLYGAHVNTKRERRYEKLTALQNQRGWPVDVKLVREMQYRYLQNLEEELANFQTTWDPQQTLNFNSPKQLVKWCKDRGVKAESFDTQHVEALLPKITAKIATLDVHDPKVKGYVEVEAMLRTKQILGGTGLKKLQVLLDTVSADGRLRDQYMHCGAGQSYRTTGRGVQMQNIKRLSGELLDMDDVFDPAIELDNDTLGKNLRQVFTSSHPDGELIVGDFSAVESRGLAWLAGADWIIDAYRKGQDLYKVLASQIFSVDYDDVTKDQRQTGKLGILSCGYQAGPVAVGRVAAAMRITLAGEDGPLKLVRDWRAKNPEIVQLWNDIDEALHTTVDSGNTTKIRLSNGLKLAFEPRDTPNSLAAIHPGAMSVGMRLLGADGQEILERVFHGCYKRGRNVCIYKPSDSKTGPAWKNHFKDPKTKEVRFFDIYGGKIAGILTQSYCREMFFSSMLHLEGVLEDVPNAEIIGQFHDEIVVNWTPKPSATSGLTLDETMKLMERAMSTVDDHSKGFPLVADIKHAYRYIK